MVRDNQTWGEERIAHEHWLKLGIRVSPRTGASLLARRRSKVPWALAELEHICPQPCERTARVRLYGRSHRLLSKPVYLSGDGGRFESHPSLQRDGSGCVMPDQHIGTRNIGDSQHRIKHLPLDKAGTEALRSGRPKY
jgi:hypothetical protein